MMFDPKEKRMINKTIRIEEALLKSVFEAAGVRKLSFNKFVIQCIEYAMENLKTDENNLPHP
jgi:predicted HicB family RNase H-like nuclease